MMFSSQSSARPFRRRANAGFSLVELLVSVGVLLTVLAIVCEQIASMQKMSASEAAKLDITQQTREFLNQTVRDIHMSGYPGPSMFATQPTLDNPSVAAGLVSVSPTQIIMEGDVNGEGQVYSVAFTYVAADPNDPNCPCLRRGAIPKSAALPWAQPAAASYTEATHLVPPGTGPGQSGQDIFEFLDRTGNPVDLSSGNTADPSAGSPVGQGPVNLAKIAVIKVNLTLATPQKDPASGQPVTVALSALARPRQ